jgi:hypothetical protein
LTCDYQRFTTLFREVARALQSIATTPDLMHKLLAGILGSIVMTTVTVQPLWADEALTVGNQAAQLTTATQVLDRYQQALGGEQAIANVQSMTVRGEAESTATGRSTFIYYAKPFKSLFKITRADSTQITAGFDGKVSWTITSKGAEIDKDTPLDAIRRDADLQYPLHQPDYFKKLELGGIRDFEGHRCYWLHGTTNWGKDNNQFYDVETGLLVGYRFESDDLSKALTFAIFEDYRNFGGPLIATRNTTRAGNNSRTFIYKSVSYEPLADSIFELPPAVKALVK